MLSAEERRLIEEEAHCYPDRRALSIDALRIVQRIRGWISDDALADIAAYLEVSVHELDAVATFYNLIHRRPVGRHVIVLCDSVSCWLMGYPALRRHLCSRLGVDLGGTSADGQFTLLPSVCLGRCEQAPFMLVNEDPHGELTDQRLDDILERYR